MQFSAYTSYKMNHLEYQYCTMEADPGPPKIWSCELFLRNWKTKILQHLEFNPKY